MAADRTGRGADDGSDAVPAGAAPDAAGAARGRPRPRVRIRAILLTALLTYAGVSVLVGLLQSKLIYFPTRGYESTPADFGLPFDDSTLRTADGLSIAAWYVPAEHAKGTLIHCHGNAGNIADRLHDLERFHRMGLSVLIFDYRGYGRSEGSPNEEGTYEDAETAWRYVTQTRGERPDRVVLFGRSLGGAVAIELARRHPPAALIVESTFTSLVDVGRLHYPWLPVSLIVTYRYESITKIPKIVCPKLFFHGADDSLIPIRLGRRLFDAAIDPKEFIETPGDHNEAGYACSREFTARLAAFVDRVLDDGKRQPP